MPFLIALFFTLISITPWANAQQSVYRCGNSYSQTGCAGGKAIDNQLSIVQNAHNPGTVYLCKSQGDSLFWSSNHCRHHNAYLERTELVPSNLPWQQQVEIAQAQWRKAQQNAAPSRQIIYSQSSEQSSASGNAAVCESLDAEVKRLDQMSRAGSRYYNLDEIRQRRKQVRDEQYRLRC